MQNRPADLLRKLNALRIAVLPESDRSKLLDEIRIHDPDVYITIGKYLKELAELEIDQQSLKLVIADLESEALNISESDETLVGRLNRYNSDELYKYIGDFTKYDLAMFVYASDELKIKKLALQRLEKITDESLSVLEHQLAGCEKTNHCLIEKLTTMLDAGV